DAEPPPELIEEPPRGRAERLPIGDEVERLGDEIACPGHQTSLRPQPIAGPRLLGQAGAHLRTEQLGTWLQAADDLAAEDQRGLLGELDLLVGGVDQCSDEALRSVLSGRGREPCPHRLELLEGVAARCARRRAGTARTRDEAID